MKTANPARPGFLKRLSIAARYAFGYGTTQQSHNRKPRRGRPYSSEDNALPPGTRDKLIRDLLQAHRDNPLVWAIRRLRRQDVVGRGLLPKPRTGSDTLNEEIEGLWREWSLAPEVSGMNLPQVQKHLATAPLCYGDAALLLINDGTFKFVTGDRVGHPDPLKAEKDGIFHGIRTNRHNKPVAYFIGDKDAGKLVNAREYPANRVLFHRKDIWPGHLRGIPELEVCFDELDDIDEFDEIEMVAAKAAASFAVFIEKERDGLDLPGTSAGKEPGNALPEYINPGTIEELAVGEKVSVVNPNSRPNVNAVDWLVYKLRKVGTPLGIPVEFLLMTIGNVSFSASQGMVLFYQATVEEEQNTLIPTLEKLYRWRLAKWILERKIKPTRDVKIDLVDWQKPAFRWVNRAAQVKADQVLFQLGATCLDDITAPLGRSAFDVMERKAAEIKKAQEIATRYGLENWRDLVNPMPTYGSAAVEPSDPQN